MFFFTEFSFVALLLISEITSSDETFYKDARYSGPKIRVNEVDRNQKIFPRLEASYSCGILFRQEKQHIVWPPPRTPPHDVHEKFTMGGRIPVSSFYFAQKYNGETAMVDTWSQKLVDSYIKKTENLRNRFFDSKSALKGKHRRTSMLKGKNAQRRYTVSHYGFQSTVDVAKAMHSWNEHIKGCRILVVGSENPWLEGMLLSFGAKEVTTLEYGRIISQHPLVQTITVDEMRSAFSQNQSTYFRMFDTAFSFSSIEHSGLGRYGDPINPFGDLEQVAQVSCLLRKGGVFFLGFGIGKDKIEWNAHRIYGKVRLPFITVNFALLDIVGSFDWKKSDFTKQPILVLKNMYSGN